MHLWPRRKMFPWRRFTRHYLHTAMTSSHDTLCEIVCRSLRKSRLKENASRALTPISGLTLRAAVVAALDEPGSFRNGSARL